MSALLKMDRIAQLRRFIEQSPDEPFPRYALALELKGKGDLEGGCAEMQELVRRVPGYLGAYLQLGMMLQSLGRNAEARAAFQGGQELARTRGDSQTLSELTTALESLGP
jgi:hypothetical protein